MRKSINYSLAGLILLFSNSALMAQKKPKKKAKEKEINNVPIIPPKISDVDSVQTEYGKTMILPCNHQLR